MRLHKLFLFFLLIVAAVLAQWKFKIVFGWAPDFVLVVLLTAAFFADFLTIIFLSLLCIWILNWQPAASPETALLILLPAIAHFARNFFPYRPWLNNLAVVFIGLVVFYFFANQFLFLDDFFIFLLSSILSLLSGAFVFMLLESSILQSRQSP